MAEKSIIESALMDVKRIQEALNANTKEILRNIAIEEIDKIVKESIEEDYVEEDADDIDTELEDSEELDSEEIDLSDDDLSDDELEIGDDLSDDELEGDYEVGMDTEVSDLEVGDEEIDMTSASDDEVISVYKKLTGDDEIEVVVDSKSGDMNVSVQQPGDYVIKTESGVELSGDDEIELDFDSDMTDDLDDELVYEIELDEAVDIESVKAPVGSEKDNWAGDNLKGGFDEKQTYAKAEGPMVMHEEDDAELSVDEEDSLEENLGHTRGYAGKQGARKVGAAHHPSRTDESVEAAKIIKEHNTKYKQLLSEATDLKQKNEEYKEALKKFRSMLAETVVFNSNLTYVTKLFMEHSTTKEEKQQILKRFDDEVTTIKESKKLYKTIVNELGSRKSINESIGNKINKEVSSGTSKQLNESTAYIDKETLRIKDLINRVEKR